MGLSLVYVIVIIKCKTNQETMLKILLYQIHFLLSTLFIFCRIVVYYNW